MINSNDLRLIPEVYFAEFMSSLGFFDADQSGDQPQKQISFLDEGRAEDDQRIIMVRKTGTNPNNGLNESCEILVVVVSKKDKTDSIETNLIATKISNEIDAISSYEKIFLVSSRGVNGPFIMESGRHAFEVRFNMQYNFLSNCD